jgi:uncharacterized protein YndB with AHSA1/START domain
MVGVTTPSETDAGTVPTAKTLRVRIDAPPDSVRLALTDADTMTEWFAEQAEVALDEGQYEFWGRYTPHGDRPHQQLTSADPLSFRWELAGTESTVDVGIVPDGDGTVVTVTHTGYPVSENTALDCFWHVSLANLVAQCEGVATMPPFDFSAPAQGDSLIRTVIDVPAEQVFASLLDPSQVDKWAGGTATIEPEVGGRYDFGWDHGPTTIVELEQDKVLAYGWSYPDSPDTLVRWQLREARGSTFLTLVHSGFADDALAEQFRQGWPGFLVELKRILELGPAWQPITVT